MAEKSGKRYALVIDSRKCINCKACVVACKAENGVPVGKFRDWINEERRGPIRTSWPPSTRSSATTAKTPPACGSTPRGLMAAGGRHRPGELFRLHRLPLLHDRLSLQRQDLREDLGVVDKCTLCAHRVDRGQVPACVETCPSKVRVFGDLNDTEGVMARAPEYTPILVKKPETGNGPQLYYLL